MLDNVSSSSNCLL